MGKHYITQNSQRCASYSLGLECFPNIVRFARKPVHDTPLATRLLFGTPAQIPDTIEAGPVGLPTPDKTPGWRAYGEENSLLLDTLLVIGVCNILLLYIGVCLFVCARACVCISVKGAL